MGLYDQYQEDQKKKKTNSVSLFDQYTADRIEANKTPSQKAAVDQKKKNIFNKVGDFIGGILNKPKKALEEKLKVEIPSPVTSEKTPLNIQTDDVEIINPISKNLFDTQIKSASANLTPEAREKAQKRIEPALNEINRLEDKKTLTDKLDWRDKIYDITTDPAKLVPFVHDAKEIPEVVKLVKAADRLKKGKATAEDAQILQQWLEQQNRDSSFGYKVLDVVTQAIPFGLELYLTAGSYTVGKEAAKKGLKNLMTKSGKKAIEKSLEKFGYKVVAGVAGATVQSLATAPIKVTKDVLERQLTSNLQEQFGVIDTKESLMTSISKSLIDNWVEVVSERSGDAFSMLATPLKNKLLKISFFKAISKLNPSKGTKIAILLEKSGYDGVINEMLEERVGEISRGLLNKVGLSDEKFKLPSWEQLAVEAVSFSVPGIANVALGKLSGSDTIQMTPDGAIDSVEASDLKGTPEGDKIIEMAEKAKKAGKLLVVDLTGQVGEKITTPDKNTVGLNIDEESAWEAPPKAPESTETDITEQSTVKKEKEVSMSEKYDVEVAKEAESKDKYPRTLNLQNKDDVEYLKRIFPEQTVEDMKKGIFDFRGKGKDYFEEISKHNIIDEPYTKPKLETTPYTGQTTFYHGTSPNNIDSIMTDGFKKGSDLPENAFRGGGYGEAQQKSISFSGDVKMASRFTGNDSQGAVIESKLKPDAKVVEVKGIEDANDLNDYADELIKQGIDAVWIGGGENELVVLNPKAILPVKSQIFKVAGDKKELSTFSKPKITEKKTTEKPTTQTPIENIKSLKDVKTSLKNIKTEFEKLTTEAQGIAEVAQEQRSGLNTNDIAKLKRIYARSQKFQEGDIETIRASNTGALLDRVLEDVMIKYPAMDSEQAFNFALNLPNKSLESVKKSPEMKKLAEKQKTLSKYLELLKEKEKELKLNKSNELMDDWQKTIDAQDNLSQIVEVPKEQLPVGTGKTKVSRLAARVKGVLNNLTPEKIESLGLATYNQMIKKEQRAMAADYVINNRKEAMEVLEGKRDPPRGLLRNSIYVAMENIAGSDTALAMDLASLQSTRFGQELSILTELDPDSPVKIMRDIVQIREKVVEKKLGTKSVQKVKSEIKQSLVDKIAKTKPNKYSWESFLKEVAC